MYIIRSLSLMKKKLCFILILVTCFGIWWNLLPKSQKSNIPFEVINCAALFAANESEIEKAFRQINEGSNEWMTNQTDQYFVDIDCPSFLLNKGYVLEHLSKEETDFPLAFSFAMFKDVTQFERLLRALYRPQNAYCVHVDLNASQVVHQAVHHLASCFPAQNVIVANSVGVKWGKYSVLQADLICFEELLNRFKTWKYLINLTGQEFPLKTHREMVRILKILNGANSVEAIYTRRNFDRFPTEKIDFPLTWYKGSVHVLITRAFVSFLFNDDKARQIHQLLKKTNNVPDETLYSTLNHNPQLGTPGAYLGGIRYVESNLETYIYIARFKNWGSYPCHSGKIVRDICIWGIRDLPLLADKSRFELFVNKFYWDFQHYALDCMEQRFWERSYRDYLENNDTLDIDEEFYRNLSIVKLHQ